MLQIEPLSVFLCIFTNAGHFFFFFFYFLSFFFVVSPKFQLLAVNCQYRLCLCMYSS